ncbi:metallophosphoesterase [Paraburkholderia dinghuensis]|uniref:Metallophosphoesterase n=1 Tax=Paraburkholderia dinghuensis TaxID=2305225 RepID=A0A3N6MP43_9BURK|nr:metallophosphoesterase [Paraburkholderia dinghuensis]RQH05684.1 metallophosphoesterase [Paraburkholderia dinghuensis]
MTRVTVPVVQHHESNRAGRDFVIGDLHGCVDALRYLLREAGFDPSRDRLFSVGDLVDRGDQSEEALALIDEPWFFPVLGNHEDTMCGVAEGRLPRYRWYGIGGAWAEKLADGELVREAERLRRLPLVRVVGAGAERFNVLHAEFFGDDNDLDAGRFNDAVRERMLWGRELALGTVKPPKRALSLTYCGHTPVHEVKQIGSQMFIDTGAFIPEGRLTMVEALTTRSWSVSTIDARKAGAADFALP